jgi:hypothetical protein
MLGSKDRPVVCTSLANLGQAFNKPNVRRGDQIEIPSRLDAEVFEARGMVAIGKVPLDKLGPAFRQDDNRLAELQREVNERTRKQRQAAEERREGLPRRDFETETRRDIQLAEAGRMAVSARWASEVLRLGRFG